MSINNPQNLISPDNEPLKKKHQVVIAGVNFEQQARDVAEQRLLSSKEELKGLKGFWKKIWNHNLAYEYYRQKEIFAVRREIEETKNLYQGEEGTQEDHARAMEAIVQRFTNEFDDNLRRSGEMEKVLDENSPEEKEIKEKIKQLIIYYAGDKISEEDFNLEKENLFKSEIRGVKDENNKNIIDENSLYADNLLEMAKQVKSSIAHGASLDKLDEDLEIKIGKARIGVDTEMQSNFVDKTIEKIKRNRVGRIINEIATSRIGRVLASEETLALATAIAYSATAKIFFSAANKTARIIGGLGLGAGVGGTVAGIRENKRIKEERAQHGREMAKGGQIEKDSARREEMEKYRHETRNAKELTNNLQGALAELKNAPDENKLQIVLENLNEISARIAFSDRKKIDLVSFSDAKNVEQERTEMSIAIAQAKVFLKNNINAEWSKLYNDEKEMKEYLAKNVEEKNEKVFLKEMSVKDKAFKKMKREKIFKAALKGAGIGFGIGLAFQEASAALGHQEGIFSSDSKHVAGQPHKVTALKSLYNHVTEKGQTASMPRMHDVSLGQGASVKLPEGIGMAKNPDGTFNLFQEDTHKAIAGSISFNPDGTLSEASKNMLQANGISSDDIVTHIDGPKIDGGKNFINSHESLFSKITRTNWAENNTPRPDKNELRLLWGGAKGTGIDAKGNFVFNVKHMTQGGSFHGAKHWDAQSLMKAGKMKMLLSLSEGTQNQVVEVPIDANGNAMIDPNSEIGKIAFKMVDGHAKFLGKFAEVAVVDGNSGAGHVNILATHIGDGIKDVPGGIDQHTTLLNVSGETVENNGAGLVGLPGEENIIARKAADAAVAILGAGVASLAAGRTPLEKLGKKNEPVLTSAGSPLVTLTPENIPTPAQRREAILDNLLKGIPASISVLLIKSPAWNKMNEVEKENLAEFFHTFSRLNPESKKAIDGKFNISFVKDDITDLYEIELESLDGKVSEKFQLGENAFVDDEVMQGINETINGLPASQKNKLNQNNIPTTSQDKIWESYLKVMPKDLREILTKADGWDTLNDKTKSYLSEFFISFSRTFSDSTKTIENDCKLGFVRDDKKKEYDMTIEFPAGKINEVFKFAEDDLIDGEVMMNLELFTQKIKIMKESLMMPSVPLKTVEEEKKIENVRAFSSHVLYKLGEKGINSLNTPTMDESDKKFVELAKKAIDVLTVHGSLDRKTGNIISESDLDGKGCIKLFNLAGIDTSSVNYVKHGDTYPEGVIADTSNVDGVVTEEDGKRVIMDHHGEKSDRTTSATKHVYETLVDFGLLKREDYLDKYVEYVTKCDNENYSDAEFKEVFENYERNMYGLRNKMTSDEICNFFKKGVNPADKLSDYSLKKLEGYITQNYKWKKSDTSKKKHKVFLNLIDYSKELLEYKNESIKEIAEMEKAGFVFDTGDDRFGKILIDTKKINPPTTNKISACYPKLPTNEHIGQLAARDAGYGGYLVMSEVDDNFHLTTNRSMDETSIPGGFPDKNNLLSVRGGMIFKTGASLDMTLEDVLRTLKGDPDFKLEGRLKEAIDNENNAREAEIIKFQEENSIVKKQQISPRVNPQTVTSSPTQVSQANILQTPANQSVVKSATMLNQPPVLGSPIVLNSPIENIPQLSTPERKNWQEVKRETEVLAIEDLDGDIKVFEKNIKVLGVAEKDINGSWKWKGGDKKLVFLGDILGDRKMNGVEIISIIDSLSEQAENQGGKIDIICGNHDLEFIRFLGSMRSKENILKDADLLTSQNIGIWELAKFDPDKNSELRKINTFNMKGAQAGQISREFISRQDELWVSLYERIPEIIANMKTTQEGRDFLENICKMKIVDVRDDTLFCHTDPTGRMVNDLTQGNNIQQRVVEVNNIFQENLRKVLLGGEEVGDDYRKIENIYLRTDNREYFVEAEMFNREVESILERILENLYKDNKIEFEISKEDFSSVNGIDKLDWENWIDYSLDNMNSFRAEDSDIENELEKWKNNDKISGDFINEIRDVLKAFGLKDLSQLEKSKAVLIKKIIEQNPVENKVNAVRDSGINTIVHGHSPKDNRYYDANGLLIVSPHSYFGGKKGTMKIGKNGNVELAGNTFRK